MPALQLHLPGKQSWHDALQEGGQGVCSAVHADDAHQRLQGGRRNLEVRLACTAAHAGE